MAFKVKDLIANLELYDPEAIMTVLIDDGLNTYKYLRGISEKRCIGNSSNRVEVYDLADLDELGIKLNMTDKTMVLWT